MQGSEWVWEWKREGGPDGLWHGAVAALGQGAFPALRKLTFP